MQKILFGVLSLVMVSQANAYPTESIYKYFRESSFTISLDIPGKGSHCLSKAQDGLKMESCAQPKWAVMNQGELWQVSPYLSASGGYVHLYLLSRLDGMALSFTGQSIPFLTENNQYHKDLGNFLFWDLDPLSGYVSGYFHSDPLINQAIVSRHYYEENGEPKSDYLCMDVELQSKTGIYYAYFKKTSLERIREECMGFSINVFEGRLPKN